MATATKLALDYAAALTLKFADSEKHKFAAICYSIIPGKKYDKLVQGRSVGNHSGVAGFIDRSTGDLYKPASWAKPAQHIRYSGATLLTTAVAEADPYGGYLYI